MTDYYSSAGLVWVKDALVGMVLCLSSLKLKVISIIIYSVLDSDISWMIQTLLVQKVFAVPSTDGGGGHQLRIYSRNHSVQTYYDIDLFLVDVCRTLSV